MISEEAGPAELEAPSGECTQCGAAALQAKMVRSAFWQDERLVVIDGIPALVCEACQERFYDDATVMLLDLKRGEGFRPEDAVAEMLVPVFTLRPRTAAQEPD
jgi:YgiT-type zinc finger domain-containing protein